MNETREKFTWYPKSYVTEVPEDHTYVAIYRDYWWAVDADRNIAFYEDRSPQCNMNENIVKRYVKNGVVPGAVAIEQLPLAFVRIKISDYCN